VKSVVSVGLELKYICKEVLLRDLYSLFAAEPTGPRERVDCGPPGLVLQVVIGPTVIVVTVLMAVRVSTSSVMMSTL